MWHESLLSRATYIGERPLVGYLCPTPSMCHVRKVRYLAITSCNVWYYGRATKNCSFIHYLSKNGRIYRQPDQFVSNDLLFFCDMKANFLDFHTDYVSQCGHIIAKLQPCTLPHQIVRLVQNLFRRVLPASNQPANENHAS